MKQRPLASLSFSSRTAITFALTALACVAAAAPAVGARLPGPDPVIAAAGDISCPQGPDGATSCRDQATSDLLVDQGLARVLALGDNQYESGLLTDFESFYHPTWGRVKDITSPTPGNHDPFSSGYSLYFGSRAPAPYYSFDIGEWHLISLDSTDVSAEQLAWLRSDLDQNASGKCVLGYWHHPRFSSGTHHGNSTTVLPFWTELYSAGAEIVLSGHEHNYERFAPQAPNGTADPEHGIRQFVVGTGGRGHYSFGAPQPHSEVRSSSAFGVLELALRPGGYDWLFVPAAGDTFSDSGTGSCHGEPANAYPRPRSAAQFRTTLVPAYAACVTPNGMHGPPLEAASCNPPMQQSGHLTVGTPDANSAPPNMTGTVRFRVVKGDAGTPADEADVAIDFSSTDVRVRTTLEDYTGELRGRVVLRITDRLNGATQNEAATVVDTPYVFTVPCAATSGAANIGGACALTTTADAIAPGTVTEKQRAVWQVRDVTVLDGGADGDAETPDNSTFLRQGVFVP